MNENDFLIKAREDTKKKIEIFDQTPQILDDIDREFENYLKLNKIDVCYLFLATALHCLRIYVLNKITMIEKAGTSNRNEKGLHKIQDGIFSKLKGSNVNSNDYYYASLNHIITARGVPYDTQKFCDLQNGQFKGANHRFSTLGHEPILGLVFGTSNIMTNTITFNNFYTNHVLYDNNGKNPQIATLASTTKMLKKSYERLDNEIEAFVAALIKQMLHIGTDMYTPKGIQLPFIGRMALDKGTVERITKYISFGDTVKIGASFGSSSFINYLIKTIYCFQFERTASNFDIFETKINNIILYAESIAEGSNLIITAIRMAGGDEFAIKNLDVGGIINLINKICRNKEFQRQIKNEYLVENYVKKLKER